MIKNILILLLIIALIICFSKKTEQFEKMTPIQKEQNTLINKIAVNKLDDKQADLLYDPLFQNLIVYNNDLNPFLPGEESGLDKCLNKCNGNCVEYGMTGTAWCFN